MIPVPLLLLPLVLAMIGARLSKKMDEGKLILAYLILCVPSLCLFVFSLFWLWAVGGLIETPAILSAWTFLVLFILSRRKQISKIHNRKGFFEKAVPSLLILYAVITLAVITLCARNLLTEGFFGLRD